MNNDISPKQSHVPFPIARFTIAMIFKAQKLNRLDHKEISIVMR